MQIHAEHINLADVPCGRSEMMKATRIVGGQNAVPHEFPWLVSITKNNGHHCGGVILNDKFVLTAGHCLCSSRDSNIYPVRLLGVTLGKHNFLTPDIPAARQERIKDAVLHPGYKCGKYVDDIALLELIRPISWSESVKPACLPVATEKLGYSAFDGVNAITAGWGLLGENKTENRRPDVLQKVEVQVVANDICNEWYASQKTSVKINPTQMCAGFEEGGKDSCRADSGGPLMFRSHPNEPLMVIGVVSSGIGCARARLPGIYTRLSDYVSWIMQEINHIYYS